MSDELWTSLKLIEWTASHFKQKGILNPRVDAEWLLAATLNCKRIDLYVQHEKIVSLPELARFRELVKRRATREPLQYIVGTTEFYGLEIKVTPDVLIPRPETELLVQEVIQFCGVGPVAGETSRQGRPGGGLSGGTPAPPTPSENSNGDGWPEASILEAAGGASKPLGTAEHKARLTKGLEATSTRRAIEGPMPEYILDIGTGSGCIALALAAHLPDALIDATELSAAALSVARANAEHRNLSNRINFYEADLFPPGSKPYDLIVSNPPYIESSELKTLQAEVRDWEPRRALDGGADGLEVYRHITKNLETWLKPMGVFIGEIGATQGQAIRNLLLELGIFKTVELKKDLAGHDRIVVAKRVSLS